MPVVAGPVGSRILVAPKEYEPFIDFYCGKDRLEKHEVNRTVRRLWAGTAMPQQAVVLEKLSGGDVNGHPLLIGVCGVAVGGLRGVPGVTDQSAGQGAYIVAIGIDVDYQKGKLEDGLRCGNALLRGVLEEIRTIFSGSVPYVFAKVKPSNTGSKCLFDEHFFEDMGNHGGEHVLLRDPDIDPADMREPTWSKTA